MSCGCSDPIIQRRVDAFRQIAEAHEQGMPWKAKKIKMVLRDEERGRIRREPDPVVIKPRLPIRGGRIINVG